MERAGCTDIGYVLMAGGRRGSRRYRRWGWDNVNRHRAVRASAEEEGHEWG